MSRRKKSLEERFWSKVDRRSPDECWPWTAWVDRHGYGAIQVETAGGWRPIRAPRVAYMLTSGDPGAEWVLHSCDNPPCCNPAHLRLGTPADNMNDQRERSGRFRRSDPLTNADVREIRARAQSENQTDVARAFGIDHSAVSLIVNGKIRAGVS